MKNNRSSVKAIMVVIIYLILLLLISGIAKNEMGSMEQGFVIVLYGFFSFTYFLLTIKDGFPITISNTTDDVFWLYVVIGIVIYVLIIFISHYYIFKKTVKRRLLLIIAVNIIIIISYLFFEASIIGFATV